MSGIIDAENDFVGDPVYDNAMTKLALYVDDKPGGKHSTRDTTWRLRVWRSESNYTRNYILSVDTISSPESIDNDHTLNSVANLAKS